jgi:hypothetical protein
MYRLYVPFAAGVVTENGSAKVPVLPVWSTVSTQLYAPVLVAMRQPVEPQVVVDIAKERVVVALNAVPDAREIAEPPKEVNVVPFTAVEEMFVVAKAAPAGARSKTENKNVATRNAARDVVSFITLGFL